MMGVKCIGFGAVSNPATGTVEAWTHEPEFYLHSVKKSLAGLKKVIWKIMEKYEFNSEHRALINFKEVKSLKLKKIPIADS